MKKALLFLFILSSVYVTAQKQVSVTFDFSNPTALTPSITPREEINTQVLVTNKTFTEGPISISFANGSTLLGVGISTNVEKKYYLEIYETSEMKLMAGGNATLDRMVASSKSSIGPLELKTGANQPGIREGKEWYRKETESNVKSVTFANYGISSKIYTLTVYYTTPSDILKPLTSTISNGDELPSFENLVLTFDRSMTVASTEGMTLTRILEEGNEETALTASASGSEVAISADKKIEKNGTYKITIPARCLKDADGWENAALEYTFTINVPKNTFEYVSVEPAPGRVEAIQSGIRLSFGSKVSDLDAELTPIRMFKDEEETPYRLLGIEKDAEDENSVILNFINETEDITGNGTYKITIPEKYIYNTLKGDAEYERYNPEIVLTYTISDEPEPLPEPDPVEIECTLTPATSDGTVVTLTLAFAEGSEVSLATETGAYFTNTAGDNTGDATITAAEGGTFLVNIAALSFGNYILNIPEGMFNTNTEDDRTAKVKAISKSFTIERIETGDFNYDLADYSFYDMAAITLGWGYVTGSFFKDFTIYRWNGKRIFADPNKKVRLVDFSNINHEIATGHFEPTSIVELQNEYAIKIVLDDPTEGSNLKKDKYVVYIEPATFGDENFGKYLSGDYSVNKEDCHVNIYTEKFYSVDNNKATSIEGIEADTDTDMRIYNIMGQPVKSMDAPGIYIINGKKYIKK